MEEFRKKAYAYTRVSTMNQVDGFSLEGQINEIKKYCEYNNIEIVNHYSDEGKSGTNIKGRPSFQRMMMDIKEKKEVNYVIVWKLSRFGRNAQDTLNSLDILKKHGVDLLAKEDNIDSGSKMGTLIITLLSALAEMERDNIIEQTKNGKKVAANKASWNGGQAPYGYRLVEKKLVVNEEEREIVKKIYNLFTIEQVGYSGIAGILNKEGIKPRQAKRKDLKAMLEAPDKGEIYIPDAQDWDSSAVRRILDNPAYCGKFQWGKNKIITGEDGKKKRTIGEDITLVDDSHEAIIDEVLWNATQLRRKETGIKFNSGSSNPNIRNMLNGIMKCPECGNGMVSMKGLYNKKNGEASVYYTYICGYYNNHKHGKCNKNPIKALYIEGEVIDAIKRYLKRPNVLGEITSHMQGQTDDKEVAKEIEDIKGNLMLLEKKDKSYYDMIEGIGKEGSKYKNYNEDKINKMIDNIYYEIEAEKVRLQSKEEQLKAIRENKLTADNIKRLIEEFDLAFENADSEQKKRLVRSLISEVTLDKVKGERGKDKVIPKSMKLNFGGEQIDLLNDEFRVNNSNVETVVLMSRIKISRI